MEDNFNEELFKSPIDRTNEQNKVIQENTGVGKSNDKIKEEINAHNILSFKTKGPKNILKIIGKIVLWLIAILCITILTRVFIFKKYDVFGYRFYLIMSGSMEPTINVNDGIITKDTKDLKKGDIIAFSEGNITTVHRIVKVYTKDGNKMYRTKGDNNNMADNGLVQQSKVKGVVVCKIPKIGKGFLFLKRNIIILVFAIVLLFFAILIKRLI